MTRLYQHADQHDAEPDVEDGADEQPSAVRRRVTSGGSLFME